jgi:hypothetical protein
MLPSFKVAKDPEWAYGVSLSSLSGLCTNHQAFRSLVSKQVVGAHNGIIGVESGGEGEGATFYIELATYQYEDRDMEHNIPSEPTASPSVKYYESPKLLMSPNLNKFRSSKYVTRQFTKEFESPALFKESSFDDPGMFKRNISAVTTASAGVGHLFYNIPEESAISPEKFISPHAGDEKYHILVVDDVLIVRKMVQRALTDIASSIHLASNGFEAIELVNGNGINFFDIILLDAYMPHVSHT